MEDVHFFPKHNEKHLCGWSLCDVNNLTIITAFFFQLMFFKIDSCFFSSDKPEDNCSWEVDIKGLLFKLL